jgi:hypothetical protein
MAGKKKTIITIETWERIVLPKQQTQTLRCALCAAEVVMLSLAQAAKISNTDEQALIRRIQSGELHFIKTTNNTLLICSHSLSIKNCD